MLTHLPGHLSIPQAATTWFFSTDAGCEAATLGGFFQSAQLGYIPTVKVTNQKCHRSRLLI